MHGLIAPVGLPRPAGFRLHASLFLPWLPVPRIYQALEDNGGKGEITWTTADNQRVPLGVSDFATINGAAANRSNALHIKYNELKEQVNACTTVDEVEAIEWE